MNPGGDEESASWVRARSKQKVLFGKKKVWDTVPSLLRGVVVECMFFALRMQIAGSCIEKKIRFLLKQLVTEAILMVFTAS